VYLTTEQCQALLQAAKADSNPQVYLFCLIGLETGMRLSEILSITLENIHAEQGFLYIPKAKAGARPQPLTHRLASVLSQYVKASPSKVGWLFPSIGNLPSTVGYTTCMSLPFKRVVLAAGLDPKQVTPHTLRHTAISHLVQSGVDLPTVKTISGHKTLAMVERYSHQNGGHIQQAMERLEARYNQGSNTITQELHKPQSQSKTSGLEASKLKGFLGNKNYPLLEAFRTSLLEMPPTLGLQIERFKAQQLAG
jgi:integrase